MATIKQIQFKRSNTAGKRPLPADIAEGELALNIKDATLFTKNADGVIIDLGFAKGGRIDGDVIQVGNYNQTGNYIVSGYITAGDIGGRQISATNGISSTGDIIAGRGVIRTRGNEGSNAHLWFEGMESGSYKERALIYAGSQTETAGGINVRVQNGFGENQPSVLYTFSGDGRIFAPRMIEAPRIVATTNLEATRVDTRQLNTSGKPFNNSAEGYTINDLPEYVPNGTSILAINYVSRSRAMSGGTIWHQLVDESQGAEWALYTGSSPDNKMFALRHNGGYADAKVSRSLCVGSAFRDSNNYADLGNNSIALGERNSGIRNTSPGYIDIIGAGEQLVRFGHPGKLTSFSTRIFVGLRDAAESLITPPTNSAQITINTTNDNNGSGDGQTHIGYYTTDGKYMHYFRGNGSVNIDSAEGLRVNGAGGLYVTTGLTVGGVMNTNQINLKASLNTTQTPQGTYKWDDSSLATADAKSFLRRWRSRSAATVWHETVQNSLWRIATGSTDVQEEFTIDSGINRATFRGEVCSQYANGFRIAYGTHGFIIRNDGNSTYFMLTNANDNLGDYNSLRPFGISNSNGHVNIATALNANNVTLNGSINTNSTVNINNFGGAGINMNSVAGSGCYIHGSRAGTRMFYVGLGGAGTDVTLNNYTTNTNINISTVVASNRQINAPEFYLTSDATLKKDVVTIEPQRSKLHEVSIKRYAMKDGSNDNAIGVIAQDIEKVYPEFVSKNEEGIRHVNYRGLSTILWKIVQEQDNEIEEMKARLSRIEELLSK